MAWLNMEMNKAVLCANMERNSFLLLETQEPPPPNTAKLLNPDHNADELICLLHMKFTT